MCISFHSFHSQLNIQQAATQPPVDLFTILPVSDSAREPPDLTVFRLDTVGSLKGGTPVLQKGPDVVA